MQGDSCVEQNDLPTRLPRFSEDLVQQLDELNPPPVVRNLLATDEAIQELVFQAGRRSIVDELLRLVPDAATD